MNEARRRRWLDLLLSERNRRRDVSGYADGALERLLAELQEMGQRMRAVSAPGGDPGKAAALAAELAQAESWADVDAIRAPLGMAVAECIALAMTADLEAGLRLLGDYSRGRELG